MYARLVRNRAHQRSQDGAANNRHDDERGPQLALVVAQSFKAQREAMKDLTPEERREKMKENRKATDAKIKEILTPEQYTQWEKMRQENRPAGGAKPAKKEKAEK